MVADVLSQGSVDRGVVTSHGDMSVSVNILPDDNLSRIVKTGLNNPAFVLLQMDIVCKQFSQDVKNIGMTPDLHSDRINHSLSELPKSL